MPSSGGRFSQAQHYFPLTPNQPASQPTVFSSHAKSASQPAEQGLIATTASQQTPELFNLRGSQVNTVMGRTPTTTVISPKSETDPEAISVQQLSFVFVDVTNKTLPLQSPETQTPGVSTLGWDQESQPKHQGKTSITIHKQ